MQALHKELEGYITQHEALQKKYTKACQDSNDAEKQAIYDQVQENTNNLDRINQKLETEGMREDVSQDDVDRWVCSMFRDTPTAEQAAGKTQ